MVDPMSNTIFGPVFRRGASRHPLETLDTGARAVGEPLLRFASIDLDRTAVGKGLMGSLRVVELDVPLPRLSRAAIVGKRAVFVRE
jgi:hypothetical protein